ncbi:MAG TPA: hypothetical protein VJ577_03555 [Burkholderiaceae bacterium]|nr:hypothetical protein [Burkholderiaceae bacterium]
MSQQSQDVRQQLRASIKRRGRRKYNVWTGYASKGGSRPFTLDGTPNTLHLIWMEGDPDVVEYQIPSERTVARGNEGPQGTVPDAICLLRSGRIEWREVKTDEDAEGLRQKSSDQVITQVAGADADGATWRLITMREIARHATLIKNWRRGLAYLWAAADFDLRPYAYDIGVVLRSDKTMSLKQVLDAYGSEKEALLIAAFFRMAQMGEILTDLADKPFGYGTVVRGA